MNSHTEQFEPIIDENKEQAEREDWYTVSIGDKCEINGIKCRVRKITKKDIICRPENWSQIRRNHDI